MKNHNFKILCKQKEQRFKLRTEEKKIPEITFVVTQGEVEVAGDRRSQGEEEAVATQRFVFIHCADSLDHLREAATAWKSVSQLPQHLFIQNHGKWSGAESPLSSRRACASPLGDLFAANGCIHLS